MDVVKYLRPRTIGDLVAVEFDQNYCRERVTLASGGVAAQFGVVGLITASGKYAPINFSAADGSQNAAGVALNGCDATAGDTPMDTLVRGPCIVRKEELVFPAGATTNQIAAAWAQLTALGVLCRTSG